MALDERVNASYTQACRCSKEFRSGACLRQHQRQHADRNYKCSECVKHFIQRASLTRRIYEKHGGAKRNSASQTCDQCGITLSTKSSLHRHVNIYHK